MQRAPMEHGRRGVFAVLGVFCRLALATGAGAADAVVGTGTPASCNEVALDAAVASVNDGGGTITFNCGGPATINVTSRKLFISPGAAYAIDGGGLITISGQNATRIILHLRGTLYIRNITLQNGRASGAQDDASGGAIRSDSLDPPPLGVVLSLTSVQFRNNVSNLTGVPPAPFSTFDYGGGAVYSRSGILSVTNCTFANNTAANSSGGAIHARSSTIEITGSTFTANASNGGGFGGAVFTDGLSPSGNNGTLRIATSTFTNNTAWNIGGAFYFYMYTPKNESVTLDTVTFQNNRVNNNSGTIPWVGTRAIGGAGLVDGGSATIVNSTFAANTATTPTGGGSGGGVSFSANVTVTITNSTFSGNRAEGTNADSSGGGVVIYGNAQPFQIRNSTIASNYAGFTGGGIQSTTFGVLTNTIVANNTAANGGNPWNIQHQCSSQLTSGGGVLHFPNIVGAPSAGNPYCVAGAIVADPLLSPLGSNGGSTQTHAIGAASPATDAGTNVGCPATDQRGWPRPLDGDGNGVAVCDIGAFEHFRGVFADVPPGYWARAFIEAIYRDGITSGCATNPLRYCPESSVTRGQMAVFLLRSKDGGAYQPPPCTVPTFGDVPCSHNFARWIEELFSRGITSGCSASPPLYCPGNAVNRGQMAKFLLLTFEGSGYVPPAPNGDFGDVPLNHPFAGFIEELAARGITTGCSANPPLYCPGNPVTRAQMAVFLVRTFSIPL